MDIDKEGWCLQATRLASPNQNDRPDNQGIDLLVIHNISLPPDSLVAIVSPICFLIDWIVMRIPSLTSYAH